jgi:mevalonate kinase
MIAMGNVVTLESDKNSSDTDVAKVVGGEWLNVQKHTNRNKNTDVRCSPDD